MVIAWGRRGGGYLFCLMYTNVLYIFTPYLSSPSTLKGFTHVAQFFLGFFYTIHIHSYFCRLSVLGGTKIKRLAKVPKALPDEFQKFENFFQPMSSPGCSLKIVSQYGLALANISILSIYKVVIYVCQSDHNQEPPGPICLKF